jgi:hypothetical protein
MSAQLAQERVTGRGERQADAHTDGMHSVGPGDYRVQVKLSHFRQVVGESRYPHPESHQPLTARPVTRL